ncbi:FkbM family methyltransferase [Hymenobacter terrestris]|uniref:FkbM family methyltransferase n=1 Tax=Hymenobacter terrestris TaxID=2748310 RepID=A0ABX2Q5C4_9BACT|nr:FkbM family methyltransferase [Hymenobacter terrestris]NVO86170.1 FkbM family methyltransferase [Hymenobacter terrestris]
MSSLLRQLAHVEKLAASTRWHRLLHAPAKYIYAIGFRQLVYARTRRGVFKQVDTFFGVPMQVVLPAGTDLYLTGGKTHDSEIRLARLLLETLRPGDDFVDVGAHFGYFALLAARLVGPTGRVRAYEASASTYAVLAANVAALPQVQACHQAVSDQPEVVSFYEFPVLFNEFNSMDVSQFEGEKWFKEFPPVKIQVPAVPLSEVLRETRLRPRIIKIDVEGAEDKVIAGAQQVLSELAAAGHPPLVVMEYLSPVRHNASHRHAAALLAECGYAAHTLSAAGRPVPCADLDAYLAQSGQDSDNFVFIRTVES